MPDLLPTLQQFRWKGSTLPITGAEFGFRHEQTEHRYIYRDEELIESLGRKNPTFRYSIPFREDIRDPRYRNLFTKQYPQFLRDCQDRRRGILVDPVHGTFQAKCISLRATLDAGKKDGIDVDVEFVKAPFEEDLFGANRDVITLRAVAESAKQFDKAVLSGDYPIQEVGEQAQLDPFAAIGSIADQVDVLSNKILATYDDAASRAEKLERSIERAKSPKLGPVRARLRDFRSKVSRLPNHIGVTGNEKIGTYTVPTDTDVSSLAAQLGNTIAELIKKNGLLARSPTVKGGTVVRYIIKGDTFGNLSRNATEPLQ